MALTFVLPLFVPLQHTIFAGAVLSFMLYVAASSHKLRLQEAIRLDDGGWEIREAPQELKSGHATIIVVQGLIFLPKCQCWTIRCLRRAAC